MPDDRRPYQTTDVDSRESAEASLVFEMLRITKETALGYLEEGHSPEAIRAAIVETSERQFEADPGPDDSRLRLAIQFALDELFPTPPEGD